jgi:hypothetical protein
MKNLIAASALFLSSCATGPQQRLTEPQFPPGPALFVARDADSTMYLFGTMHIRRPGTPWGGARAQAGIAESEEIWTELLISPETDALTQSLAMQRGMAAPGRPLSSWLSAEENARLGAVLQGLGAPPTALDGMQPWLASLTLTILPMMRAGYDPNAGADRQIDAYGDANGKTMREFESAEEQIGMLAGMDEAVQREMLREAISEAGKGNAQMERLAAAWEAGDLATIEQMVVTELRDEYPDFYEVLLADRNDAWVVTLRRELQGSGVDFVAVGTGHLLGEDGLVAQLREAGYAVERVE